MRTCKSTLGLFTLHYAPSHSLGAIFRDLLQQAQKHQKEMPGVMVVDTILHYLIGAQLKLMLATKNVEIKLPGASVNTALTTCPSNFLLEQFAIHVTIYPTLALIEKCKENLAAGLMPIIITGNDQVKTVEILAKAKAIDDYVEIWAAEQFLAASLYKLSEFGEIERNTTVARLVAVYNQLIDKYETDPSLRISIGK